jgi:DoxX-like family
MAKRNKIIYWIATLWLALGMTSSGFFQIIKYEEAVTNMNKWGYPTFFLSIIGTWKILGVIAVLVPKYPLVKEWAYAGFFFLMTGAIFTHLAAGDPAKEFFGASLLLLLTLVSWYFRPADRKISQL